MLGHRQHLEVGTDGYDRTFAAASRFGHLRSSQRFAADHIADHHKLGGCKSGRHNDLCRAVNRRSC